MQSWIDIEALREFSHFLRNHHADIKERASAAVVSVDDMKIFWNDQKYREFIEVFETASKDLEKFLQTIEKFQEYLRQKIEDGEKYLS